MSLNPEADTVISKPFSQVLFATNFARDSEQALIEATRFASHYGFRLHLLNVVVRKGTRRDDTDPEGWDHAPVRNRTDMEELHRVVKESFPTAVARVWRDTSIPKGILSYAEREGVNLIVMGPSNRSRLLEAWRGNITQSVVRTSPVSVLVPYGRIGNRRGILAPVDFSTESRLALVHASHLAIRHKQKLTVMHVAKRKTETLEGDLKGFVARARLMGEATCTVATGDPAKVIAETAAKSRCELVVVGSPPEAVRSDAWARGNVAQLLRRSTCPVLVYRQPDPREYSPA